MALRWAITGGGTGGHVTPALALGEVIRERGDDVLFIGSDRGLEARLVPEAGFALVALRSRQVMGRGPAGRLLGIASLLLATLPALRALHRFRADIVISVGGYAALPATLAARLLRRPLILVEPNAIPGRVNRLCARLAALVFTGFESARTRFPALGDAPERVRCVGIPLRRALVEAFRGTREARTGTRPLHLLVFGGSQGARQLNEAMIEALPRIAEAEIEVFHQTGERDRARVADAYTKSGVDAVVAAFEPDMPARYRWADLALCRAGALTVAELALAGLPALLVPYPYAADDHQRANARELEAAGAARCLEAGALDGERVAREIVGLASEPDALSAMSAAARERGRPRAAEEIVAQCAALLARGTAPESGASRHGTTGREE